MVGDHTLEVNAEDRVIVPLYTSVHCGCRTLSLNPEYLNERLRVVSEDDVPPLKMSGGLPDCVFRWRYPKS